MFIYAMYFCRSYYDHVEFLLMVKYKFTPIMFYCILLQYIPCMFYSIFPKFLEDRIPLKSQKASDLVFSPHRIHLSEAEGGNWKR